MINWLRKAAAQALDLAAEAYGALATWCVRTSEQLDPYTENDYRHAQKVIADAAKAIAEDNKPAWSWTPPAPNPADGVAINWQVDPQTDLGWDAYGNHTTPKPPDGLFEQPSYWFNESDWQPRAPRDGGEHRYDETCGGCTCGWPTGKHPSETDDE